MSKKKAIPEQIKIVTRQIVENFHPDKVILFGSYAYGEPQEDSDADLMVVMNTRQRTLRKAAEIAAKIDHPIPLDILVRTPAQMKKRLALGDGLIHEVTTKGIILYEASD